jgi:hypothetical protein
MRVLNCKARIPKVSFRALLPSTNSINTLLKKYAKALVGIFLKGLLMSLVAKSTVGQRKLAQNREN